MVNQLTPGYPITKNGWAQHMRKKVILLMVCLSILTFSACEISLKKAHDAGFPLSSSNRDEKIQIELFAQDVYLFQPISILVMNESNHAIDLEDPEVIKLFYFDQAKSMWIPVNFIFRNQTKKDRIVAGDYGSVSLISDDFDISSKTRMRILVIAEVSDNEPKITGNYIEFTLFPPRNSELSELLLKNEYPKIMKIAKAWSADSYLKNYQIFIPTDKKEHGIIWMAIVRSPTNQNTELQVYRYSNGRIETAEFTEYWGLDTAKPIQENEWKIDAPIAFSIFQTGDGGLKWPSFAGECNYLILHHSDQEDSLLVWQLKKSNCVNKTAIIELDAGTGEIIE